MVAGGVSANGFLREQLRAVLSEQLPDVRFFEPKLQFCTDNAAMIAMAGCIAVKDGVRPVKVATMQPKIGWEVGR